MKICMLTSGHDVFDNRIYYKEILSLRKVYDEIYLVAPGNKDFVTKHGIIVKCFPKRKKWYDRIQPMRNIFNVAKKIDADVYHAHEPDSFQVATRLKKELGAKIIYDSHEYYPEAFAEHFGFLGPLARKLLYLYEKRLCKYADAVITVNDILVNKFKKYHDNVQLIPNYPVIRHKIFKDKSNDKPTFVYVGGLREDRGIFKILQAIEIIKNENFRYIFVGAFETSKFKSKCKEFADNKLKKTDIAFTGKIPHEKVFDYLNIAHVGFVILQPGNWRYVNSEPVKLFEYMSSKVAIIGSEFPMIKNIISLSNNGILVKPDSPKDIADAILKLGSNLEMVRLMGCNGYNKVEKLFSWNICEKRLLNTYNKLERQLK